MSHYSTLHANNHIDMNDVDIEVVRIVRRVIDNRIKHKLAKANWRYVISNAAAQLS